MSTTFYTLTVESDNETGELYITLPQEVIDNLKWDENTDLEWKKLDNNRWSIQKTSKAVI